MAAARLKITPLPRRHRLGRGDFLQENAVLAHLRRRLGVQGKPESIDPAWLLTLFTVLELERYPLCAWNEALSAVLGRRVCCPSYRALSRRLEEAVRDAGRSL